MNKLFITVLFACCLAACKKNDRSEISIEPEKISIVGPSQQDTLAVPVLKDSAIVVKLHAALDGEISKRDHIVSFRVDTTKMTAYREQFGDVRLLPKINYLFFRSTCIIPAGSNLSDAIELNIVKQLDLRSQTRYVLPIVIGEIDGTENDYAGEVFYLLIKTGKAAGFPKVEWTIEAMSFSQPSAPVTNLLDNSVTTAWNTGTSMPQFVTFNFNEILEFSKVSYACQPSIYTPGNFGGFPTQVKIEVSMNNMTWEDKGTYAGVTTGVPWIQDIGPTTAKYLRFTVLNVQPIFGIVFMGRIGDFSLVP